MSKTCDCVVACSVHLAAPELLEVVRALVEGWGSIEDSDGDMRALLDGARKALANAEKP